MNRARRPTVRPNQDTGGTVTGNGVRLFDDTSPAQRPAELSNSDASIEPTLPVPRVTSTPMSCISRTPSDGPPPELEGLITRRDIHHSWPRAGDAPTFMP